MLNLKLFNDIEVKSQGEWDTVCTLLTPPLLNDIMDYFLYTRSYQEGLDFIACCYSVIDHVPDNSDKKAFVYDTLFLFKLVLLDKMNLWDRYIEEYDAFIPMQASTIKDANRYHMIHKKLDQLSHGKNIENMKCHQRYELSNEELQKRYEYLKRRIQKHLGGL